MLNFLTNISTFFLKRPVQGLWPPVFVSRNLMGTTRDLTRRERAIKLYCHWVGSNQNILYCTALSGDTLQCQIAQSSKHGRPLNIFIIINKYCAGSWRGGTWHQQIHQNQTLEEASSNWQHRYLAVFIIYAVQNGWRLLETRCSKSSQ